MTLEISEPIAHAVDVVLLTFILVWRERQTEKSKDIDTTYAISQNGMPLGEFRTED
jgi:hypothetical protein